MTRRGIAAGAVGAFALLFSVTPAKADVALYDQFNNSGTAFIPSDSSLDVQIADDFVVPSGPAWRVTSVDVAGTNTDGMGNPSATPPTSFNVYLYADTAGAGPGATVASRPASSYTVGPASTTHFSIAVTPVVLPPGTYWVSVQSAGPSGSCAVTPCNWHWITRSVKSGTGAVIQNPNNSLGRGCTSWALITSCLSIAEPDMLFRINGTLVQHTLSVIEAVGSGTGTVTSQPAGIDCGSVCSAPFDEGSVVQLTATPAAGSTFAGWAGACSGTGSCQVTISSDQTVTATFAAAPTPQHSLTVSKAGSGSGTVTSSPNGISCGATCTASFGAGSQVTLTAAAAAGSTFTGWSGGGCAGTGPCQVTASADTNVVATFSLSTPPNTKISQAKVNRATRTATFKFKAIGSATRFQCALLGGKRGTPKFKGCHSPKTYMRLAPGTYTFEVRAVGLAGADPSAAKRKFKI